ncbi:MAG TPA: hypothetical protein VJ742_12230 [Nitrososphaera sp.]|nr:hypothetical protein [Nitrososphaera sp.]
MADNPLSRFTETYTTFSGADIVATFGEATVGSLSGITWSVTREKAPIYTMGSANPRSFSRGKRGIAGSLIFTVFDRPGLYSMLEKHQTDGSVQYFTRTSNILPGAGDIRHRGIVPVEAQSVDVVSAFPYYADQIPPFDVSITFANEYGQAASRSIYGVEILNEGSGASMDDVVIEETMTFVAREIGPMYATAHDFKTPDEEISEVVIQP